MINSTRVASAFLAWAKAVISNALRECCGIVLTITLFGVVPLHAQAIDQVTPLDAVQAKRIMSLIDDDARLASVFAMCPADAFRRDAPMSALSVRPQSDEAVCRLDAMACYRHCVDDARAGDCFGVARVLQENPNSVGKKYSQTLFAMACNAGMGAGCTNRASSLRNDPVDGEPMLAVTNTERANCEYRSFNIACRQGDAWGCTMLGQTYQYGEGVEKDARQARRYYDQACAISPSFAACDFAKGNLTLLTEPAR